MTTFRKIKTSDYSYPLPDERIAKYPLAERDASNLLVWKNGTIKNDRFKNIVHHLPENTLLVFNNTRVIHARLIFKKETGARIELFCLEPVHPSDHQLAFQEKQKVTWKCMVGNAKKWKAGPLLLGVDMAGKQVQLKAEKKAQHGNSFNIEFSWDHPFTFAEVIEKTGILPIPPYLHRESEPSDEKTYQTVYAKTDGSVAAPTAGLHFTDAVLQRLTAKNIATGELTLHVGAGTFQPVKSETIDGHTMHHEQVIVPKKFIESLITGKQKIIAVGTTSVRSLESLYWLGQKLEQREMHGGNLEISQWEPYENKRNTDVKKALQNIWKYLEETQQNTLRFSTQIIIVPGYEFKLVEGMITNFHQPQSTLLLLISAFLGNDWKKVYDYALANDFRFLSYGDSNLYLK